MKNKENILFKEVQQFRQGWLWLLLIVSFLLPLVLLAIFSFQDKASAAELRMAIALVLPVEILIGLLFYYTRLETIITTADIQFRWRPFMKRYKIISWSEVSDAEFKNGPLFRYGFGFSPGYGTVHNTAPGRGLQLTLKNRKKIFLGTRRISAMQRAVEIARTHLNDKMKYL